MTFRVKDYWDGGLVHLTNLRVPSKRVDHKKKDGVLIARVPLGVPELEAAIRETFAEPVLDRPMEGRLLVGIGLSMPESEYRKRDVYYMAKSILDAFCGLAYEDDR